MLFVNRLASHSSSPQSARSDFQAELIVSLSLRAGVGRGPGPPAPPHQLSPPIRPKRKMQKRMRIAHDLRAIDRGTSADVVVQESRKSRFALFAIVIKQEQSQPCAHAASFPAPFDSVDDFRPYRATCAAFGGSGILQDVVSFGRRARTISVYGPPRRFDATLQFGSDWSYSGHHGIPSRDGSFAYDRKANMSPSKN
jgi:hypothetical protein